MFLRATYWISGLPDLSMVTKQSEGSVWGKKSRTKEKKEEKRTQRRRELLWEPLLDSIRGNEGEAVHHQLDARQNHSRVGVVEPGADTLHDDFRFVGVPGSVGRNGLHDVNLTPPVSSSKKLICHQAKISSAVKLVLGRLVEGCEEFHDGGEIKGNANSARFVLINFNEGGQSISNHCGVRVLKEILEHVQKSLIFSSCGIMLVELSNTKSGCLPDIRILILPRI